MNLYQALKHCPLFAGLDDRHLALVCELGRQREHPPGDLLFAEGEEATGFYVVLSGRAKVYKLSSSGKERILHIIQPGQSFADAAIFGEGGYPAYAATTLKSLLFFLPRKPFLNLLKTNGELSINMIAGLSTLLRQFANQVEQMTFQDVPARLAHALLEMNRPGEQSVDLAMSKGQLASNLGTVNETLSRTFRKLQDDGLITVKGRRIGLLDLEGLELLASKDETPEFCD